MKAQLYCITCLSNSWKYWGMVYKENKSYLDRFEEHMTGKGGKFLYQGVLQYGRGDFKVELIKEDEFNVIRDLEKMYSKDTLFKQKNGWNGNTGRAIINTPNDILIGCQKRAAKQLETTLKYKETMKLLGDEHKKKRSDKWINTVRNMHPDKLVIWRNKHAMSIKGKNKNNCEYRQKQSLSLKRRWSQPSEDMIHGCKKASVTKTGRTKDTYSHLRDHSEWMKGRFVGENNSSFKGYWVTPTGRYPSLKQARESIQFNSSDMVMKQLCTSNKIITRIILQRSHMLPADWLGKRSKDIGFDFIPVD